MKYYGPIKTAFVIVPPGNHSENNITQSKNDAIFLQLRHYLASIAAFIVTGFTIYLVENNQIANQISKVSEITSKNVPQTTESLRAAAPIAPSVGTMPAQISPGASVLSSDPLVIVTAVLGATAAFFAVLFGIRVYRKFRKKNNTN
jgi:hypothetical protein